MQTFTNLPDPVQAVIGLALLIGGLWLGMIVLWKVVQTFLPSPQPQKTDPLPPKRT